MKPIVLTGRGVHLGVRYGELSYSNSVTGESAVYGGKHPPFDTVILQESHRGSVTLDALRWLGTRGVALHLVDFDGEVLTSVLPQQGSNGHAERRLVQYEAYRDPDRRLAVARFIVRRKLRDYVSSGLVSPRDTRTPKSLSTLVEVMAWEARATQAYWLARSIEREFPRAHDMRNSAINYAHAMLCSAVTKVIHQEGLDPYVGFLHVVLPTRRSLVYDLAEPFYRVADEAAFKALRRTPASGFLWNRDGEVLLKQRAIQTLAETFAACWVDNAAAFDRWMEDFVTTLRRTRNHCVVERRRGRGALREDLDPATSPLLPVDVEAQLPPILVAKGR